MTSEYSANFVEWVLGLHLSKRAQLARDILLERGSVTTADLSDLGYDHPPRAIGDLKDAGITVASQMVTVDGKRMSRYTLVELVTEGSFSRRPIPKAFRNALFDRYGNRCAVCGGEYSSRELQADHRIPFRIAGESRDLNQDDYMPLCGSDNRAKSWTCEHCLNWKVQDRSMCQSCYWASPNKYEHIAGQQERRIVVVARGSDVPVADEIRRRAEQHSQTPGEWIVSRLKELG